MELMKITDLTNELGLSSRTLRYYEQTGLVSSIRLPFEKYRYYDGESIERIRQIMVLRKMQIPVRDILRIYESHDMTVLVESFVKRIQSIDREVEALGELKRLVNKFMQALMENGISHISALPLLYERLEKQLDPTPNEHVLQKTEAENDLSRLAALSVRLATPLDLSIIDLPPMPVLSSIRKDTRQSDVEGFWNWLGEQGIPFGTPGSHRLFEYQNEQDQTVLLQAVEPDFPKEGPFSDRLFEGGLFAVCGAYLDDDLTTLHERLIRSFDHHQQYEVDYRPGGRFRHESLVESVLSPDSLREKILLYLPLRPCIPKAERETPFKQVFGLSLAEIEKANPILVEHRIPLADMTPIESPHFRILETGEAEFIPWISVRRLSTNVSVRIPFRVDIEFMVESQGEQFGYGSDEGSIRFYHGNSLYGINMENKADKSLSKEAISFSQPMVGDSFLYPGLGRIEPDVYNSLTWIVGEKHFAVALNGEVRFCGVGFPYMLADLHLLKSEPIVIGSNGQGKKTFRSIRVSQLRTTPKIRMRKGELIMANRQSNNRIPLIHQLITMHYGENYWFNGCAKYVMECLGEKDYDYSFFAGLTGDIFAQVYSFDRYRGDGATDYRLSDVNGAGFIGEIFQTCGYASTFVPIRQLADNREMYLQTLMAYIDKGVPVIYNHWGRNPAQKWGWGVFVGYEDFGRSLLFMSSDATEPERVGLDDLLPDTFLEGQESCNGWIFVGERKKDVALGDIYRNRIRSLPQLLAMKTGNYCFGPEAFRSWASNIESGRFEKLKIEQFDDWVMHTVYVCNLATNCSCCFDFLKTAMKLNPDMGFLEALFPVFERMSQLWNRQDGDDLEALGGGFNITLDALQDKERRTGIASKIRELASCTDRIVGILEEGISTLQA